MKKIFLLILLFKELTVMPQNEALLNELNREYLEDSIYSLVKSVGFQMSQFDTRSGFGSNLEASIYVKGERVSVEFGTFYENESKKITGISFMHKYFVLKNYFGRTSMIEPFLFYNFMYRVTNLDKPLSIFPESYSYSKSDSRYASIEHYFGAGVEINLPHRMYFQLDAGLGRYLGSIKKPGKLNTVTGLYSGSNNWSAEYKIGFGVRLY